jgi:hypothetical protein
MARISRLRFEPLEDRSTPATLTITNLNDSGPGSLRDAITQAEASPGMDTIDFAPALAGGTVTLTGTDPRTAGAAEGPSAFLITTPVLIQGSGQTIARGPGAPSFRLFSVTGAGARLDLQFLALTGGGGDGVSAGGAISNDGGAVTVQYSTLSGNRVKGAPGAPGRGGAIFNTGWVWVLDSTIAGNTAEGGDGIPAGSPPGPGQGGAIYNVGTRPVAEFSAATVTLNNATVAGNTVRGGSGAADPTTWTDGGVLYNLGRVSLDGASRYYATVTVVNTILAASQVLAQPSGTPHDVVNVVDPAGLPVPAAATVSAGGPNITSAAPYSTGTITGTPFTVADPLLGPLQNNGGPTPTMYPNPGSPAIDAGDNAGIAGQTTDQRGPGFARVLDGVVDVGAVEVQPPPLVVGGPATGTAVAFARDGSGRYGNTPAATLNPFGGVPVGTRPGVADVDGDGTADIVLATGPGTPVRVAVVSGRNGTVLAGPFDPFGGNFTGGAFVAAADLDGDGKAEVVVSPDQGGGPRVVVFSVAGGAATMRASFFGIDDPNFRGGARPALGDVNKDGTPDLAVAAGFLGGPRVAIFDGKSLFTGNPTRLVNDFFAFPGEDAARLRNGAFVAIGDVSGDGFADLIFGGGPGGAPRVFVLSGQQVSAGDVAGAQAAPVANFFVAGNSAGRGGVRVTAKDADGDAKADLAAGSGEGSPANVRVYLGKNFATATEPATSQDISAFGGGALLGGVYVG